MLFRSDFVAPGYVISGGENLRSSRHLFKAIEANDQTLISIGNQYGGKSPMEMQHERMMAAMDLSPAMNTARPPFMRSPEAGLEVELLEIESQKSQF